jgi:hypothetical protein
MPASVSGPDAACKCEFAAARVNLLLYTLIFGNNPFLNSRTAWVLMKA